MPMPTTSTLPSSTPSPMIYPTQTEPSTITPSPQPTLTKKQAQEAISELLAKNGSCSTPCFWGISPDVNIKDAQLLNFLSYIHVKPNIVKEGRYIKYFMSTSHKERIFISAIFTFEQESQSLLNIQARIGGLYYPEIAYGDWDAFRPDKILIAYGKPSSVEFFLNYPTEPTTDQTIAYEFRFRYDSQKFVIDYSGQRTLNQPILLVCPLQDRFIETVDIYLGDNLEIKPTNGKILQDISSVNIDDFYNAMINNRNACFYLDRNAFAN
jgi:hypothetical protein